MQEIYSSNPPVVTGIFELNISRARHHRSLKLISTKKVAKQVLRSAIVITKNYLTFHCTNTIPGYQGSIELKNEATKPTDILVDKRNIQV